MKKTAPEKYASAWKRRALCVLLILIFPTSGYPQPLVSSQPAESGPNTQKRTAPPANLLEIISYADLFYPHGRFISEVVVPNESFYFQPGVGVDSKTGMPYDHLRIRLDKGQIGERGNYTAASKLSLSIAFFLGVMQRKPIFEKSAVTPEKARELLENTLRALNRFVMDFPDYEGFFPWLDIRPNGTITPATTKLPSLDNGQLTWSLAAVVAALENSSEKQERDMAALAKQILDAQSYDKFYDPASKLMHGTIQFNPMDGTWSGDRTYYLNDMFEGVLAVLWGVLNGQVPEDAWTNLSIPSAEYITQKGEVITTLKGYRASFHEHWGLIYLPVLRSKLAPLYQNYLYVQADFARRHGLPGFLSTAYDPRGTYRQMGVPYIASQKIDRQDVSVVFATAMAALISPQVGAEWFKNIYTFRGVLTPQGAVESVGKDGYADIFTADAKGMTLLALSGGVLPEIEQYLKNRKFGGTELSMYDKLIQLLDAKYAQLITERKNERIHMPTRPYPKPSDKQIDVRSFKIDDSGPEMSITDHLQPGHLHGKNTRSADSFSLEDDIRPGHDFVFDFDVPAYFPYFDQWAFRGTYIDKAVGVSGMKFLTVSIPVETPPLKFDLEIKSDDITLAYATIDTMHTPTKLSEDGSWKTYVEPINVIPEGDYKPFNYFSVTMHDPSYLFGDYAKFGRHGEVRLRSIFLSKKPPFEEEPKQTGQTEKSVEDVELLKFWRINHGDIQMKRDEDDLFFQIPGGRGWKGGYLPYIVIENYRYLHIKVRNTSGSCNCFNIEIKNEDNQLLNKKFPVKLPANDHWYLYEVPIPPDIKTPINYLAVSDPLGSFDLASIGFSEIPSYAADEVITADPNTTLKCVTTCQKSKL